MRCPKCDSQMSQITVETVTLDRCDGCGGMFFDTIEHEQLKAAHAAARVDTGSPAAGKSHDAQARVKCPRCNVDMIRTTVHGQAHIHLDSCPVCHGTYFDAGEFADFQDLTLAERVRRFLHMRPKT